MSEKVEIVAELKDLISGKFAEINKQIDTMDGKLSNVNKSGGIMGQVLGANLLTGAISRAGGAITDFAKESFRAYGEAEQFQVALTTLLYGNADAANALNNQLKQFALSTPFELTEIQDATRLMIAYGSSAGNVVDEMRMLGDIAAGTAQPLKEVAYLYGTVRTQGMANLVDLKQFANRGIPIYKELAKVTKYTADQIVQGGKDIDITFKDVEKAFRNMVAEGSQFGGLMQKQSGTLLGQVSNLSDAWTQLQVSIGDSQSGILKNTVAWASQMVNELRKLSDRSNFADKVSARTGGSGVKSGGFFDFLNPMSEDFFLSPYRLLGMNRGGDSKDRRRMFVNADKTGYEVADSEARANHLAKLGRTEVGSVGTEERLIQFQEDWLTRFEKVNANPTDLNLKTLLADIAKENVRIDKEVIAKTISGELARSEMVTLDEISKSLKGLQDLKATKGQGQGAVGVDKTKDLEHVAKGNRPTQIIVNITNLVNELTNVVNSPKEAKQVSAEEISKVLLGAVNDTYAVAQ